MFDTALANWYGEPGAMCVHAETCGQQLALEHNGDVYSCDHYVEPGYLLGNIKEREKRLLKLVALPQQRKFGLDKRDTLTRFCRDCDVRVACNGGSSPFMGHGHPIDKFCVLTLLVPREAASRTVEPGAFDRAVAGPADHLCRPGGRWG